MEMSYLTKCVSLTIAEAIALFQPALLHHNFVFFTFFNNCVYLFINVSKIQSP